MNISVYVVDLCVNVVYMQNISGTYVVYTTYMVTPYHSPTPTNPETNQPTDEARCFGSPSRWPCQVNQVDGR